METTMAEENKSHRAPFADEKSNAPDRFHRQFGRACERARGFFRESRRTLRHGIKGGARSIYFGRSLPGRGASVFRVWICLSARNRGGCGRAFGKSLMAVDRLGCGRPAFVDRADPSADCAQWN